MEERQRTLLCEGTILIEYFGVLLGGAGVSSGSRKILFKFTLDPLMLSFLIFSQQFWSNSPSKMAETFQVLF